MYKKRYSKKRFNKKKRPSTWYSRASSVASTAYKALTMASMVKRLVNAESKFFETATSNQQSDFSGAILQTLNNPAQGNTVNQREGDSIKNKNLTIRGEISRNGVDEEFRLVIFLDKENTITTWAQLFGNQGALYSVFAAKNDDNKYDSKILHDRIYKITANQPIATIVKTIPLNFHTHFNAGSTNINDNAVKIAICSQQGTTANSSKFTYIARVTYLDN